MRKWWLGREGNDEEGLEGEGEVDVGGRGGWAGKGVVTGTGTGREKGGVA